jgi:hypothetical protein
MDRDALIEAFLQTYAWREPQMNEQFRAALYRLLEDLEDVKRRARPEQESQETNKIRMIEV